MRYAIVRGSAVLALMLLAGMAIAAMRLSVRERTLGSYATSMRGRTRGQAFNALRAGRALDGAVIPPGASLSFNQRVGPWNAAAGYRKAPASYDGELMRSYGGGVCQTATTLYNAALLAGLDITERHRHIRPPTYVSPGRDAAVAQPSVDLRLRNPYPYPVRLEARAVGGSLVIAVRGRGPRRSVVVRTEVVSVARQPVVRSVRIGARGQPGFTARTVLNEGARSRRTSQDTYLPVARLRP